MSERDNREFDLKVREMLEDAQEKVPAGVWKAVSADLGHRRQAAVWWSRAGWALAAAALILGIVLFPQRNDSPISLETSLIAQEAIAPGTDADLKDDMQPLAVTEVPKKMSTRTAAVTMPVTTVPKTTPAAEADASESSQPASSSIPAPSEERPSVRADKPQEKVSPALWNLPDEDENKKTGRKVSLQVKGAFATNKTAIQYGSAGRMGSPSIVTTGIEQTSESTFGIPFSAGIGARWYVSDRFSLGTGVNYSLLTRKFTGNFHAPQSYDGASVNDADLSHSLSYIGIPLNVYFDLVKRDPVGLYIFGGGEAERAIANNYHICKGTVDQFWSEEVSGLQWSAQLGIGVTFKVTDFMSLYVDPGVKLYFNSGQPTSVRTQQPIMFSAEIGLRFDFKK